MEFGIENCALFIMSRGKQHYGKNRTTKPRKDPNTKRKGNIQILSNTGSGHHQTNGDEGKKCLKVCQRNEGTT